MASRRCRPTGGTSTPWYDPDPAAVGRMITARGGFLKDARWISSTPPSSASRQREARDGSAAAAAARSELGSAGERRHARRTGSPAVRPACSSASRTTTTTACCSPTCPTPMRATRRAPAAAPPAGRLCVLAGLPRTKSGGRHGLLVVAGRRAPGLPEPARGRVRHRAGRRRQPDALARAEHRLLEGPHARA